MGDDLFYRDMVLDVRKLDEAGREIEASFSSETMEVVRWYGIEILSHEPGAVDLSALKRVGSHLFNHNPDRIIGPVKSARVEEGAGRAVLGYDETDEGELALKRTKNKSLRGVSVGYRIMKMKELKEDEEYQLATMKVKGKKDVPVYIITKWQPREISSTPIPADSSVGLGRDITRSLDGIEVERVNGATLNLKEDETMTREEFEKLLRESLPEALKPAMTEVIAQVRAAIAEDQRPKLRVSAEEVMELNGQAAAISPEAQIRVGQLVAEGKNADQIRSELLKLVTKKTDAGDTGDLPGDGAGLDGRTGRGKSPYGSVDKIPEDVFVRMLTNPALITLQ